MTKVYAFLLACFIFVSNSHGQEMKPIENLVFEGGGIRGVAYCGALQEMELRGKLQRDAGIGPKVKRLSSEQKELFLNEGRKGVTLFFNSQP
ncbi:MAG: hypothetical protein FJX90_04180 [Bacteroidetes bacterium]|nr:hypothetical protein [Bacteroidota bacterium]